MENYLLLGMYELGKRQGLNGFELTPLIAKRQKETYSIERLIEKARSCIKRNESFIGALEGFNSHIENLVYDLPPDGNAEHAQNCSSLFYGGGKHAGELIRLSDNDDYFNMLVSTYECLIKDVKILSDISSIDSTNRLVAGKSIGKIGADLRHVTASAIWLCYFDYHWYINIGNISKIKGIISEPEISKKLDKVYFNLAMSHKMAEKVQYDKGVDEVVGKAERYHKRLNEPLGLISKEEQQPIQEVISKYNELIETKIINQFIEKITSNS